MKFASTIIFFLCFAAAFNLLAAKAENSLTSTVSTIRNELDFLIGKLNSENISPVRMTREEQKEFLSKGQKVDLKDEILNAFQDLNNDFQQYQDILSVDHKPSNNSVPLHQIEKHLNRTMDKKTILKEISEYSDQINKTFTVLDQIKDYDRKIKDNKKKLHVIQQVQGYLKNLSVFVNITKSKASLKEQLYQSVKNLSLLYQDYFNTHRIINNALLRRFNVLKNKIEEASKVDKGINNSMTMFKRIINFAKVLKHENEAKSEELAPKKNPIPQLDKDAIVSAYSAFLTQLNEIDKFNHQIKQRLVSRIGEVSNAAPELRYKQKLLILSKMISFSKVLINLNDRVLAVKKKILGNLKKYSFQDLNGILELTKTRSTDVRKKFESLEKMRSTLKFVHDAFAKNKENLSNLKGKIVENIDHIDNKLNNIRNYKNYHNELHDIFQNIARKTRDNTFEANKIFQEIKSKKIGPVLVENKRKSAKTHKASKKNAQPFSQVLTRTINKQSDRILQQDTYPFLKIVKGPVFNLTAALLGEDQVKRPSVASNQLPANQVTAKNTNPKKSSQSLGNSNKLPGGTVPGRTNSQKNAASVGKPGNKLNLGKNSKQLFRKIDLTHEKIVNYTNILKRVNKMASKDNKDLNSLNNILEDTHKKVLKMIASNKLPQNVSVALKKAVQPSKLNSAASQHDHKLGNIHDRLIEHYSEVLNYRKDLQKVHKLMDQEKEQTIIGEKLIRCDKTLRYLGSLIEYTRFSLMNLRLNRDLRRNYHAGLLAMAKRLGEMKEQFEEMTHNDKEASPLELHSIKARISKMAELYKYLRKGAIHDYIRNQILKRIVNINFSILSNVDLKKHLNCLRMRQDLMKRL